MTEIQSSTLSMLSKFPERSVAFYREVFEMEVAEQSEWRTLLQSRRDPATKLAIMFEQGEFTPHQAWGAPSATLLTFVVPDVYETLKLALEHGAGLVQEPANLRYGMTRAVIRDPSGFYIDISTPTSLAHHGQAQKDPNRDSIQQPIGRGFEPAGQA